MTTTTTTLNTIEHDENCLSTHDAHASASYAAQQPSSFAPSHTATAADPK